MDATARRFRDQGLGAYFLYTHEAHPGEHYPHLTSMTQKVRHAEALRDDLGVARTILVDSLDGACHRAFGSMPNMSWIFNRTGIPVYKSDWTDSHSVENAIRYFLEVKARRRKNERMAPFRVDRLDYRIQDRERFFEGLARNGPKAVREFEEAFSEEN